MPYCISGGSSAIINNKIVITGKDIDSLFSYDPVNNNYTQLYEFRVGNKILCDKYILMNQIGIFKVNEEDHSEIKCYSRVCDIGESVWIASYTVKRNSFYYFMNIDEHFMRFNSISFEIERINLN